MAMIFRNINGQIMRVNEESPLATAGASSSEAEWANQLNNTSGAGTTQQFLQQQGISSATQQSAAEQQMSGFNQPLPANYAGATGKLAEPMLNQEGTTGGTTQTTTPGGTYSTSDSTTATTGTENQTITPPTNPDLNGADGTISPAGGTNASGGDFGASGGTTDGLPEGMTQLTSPDQIASYDIKGRVGVEGEPGSYLYGTPKAGTGGGGDGSGDITPDLPGSDMGFDFNKYVEDILAKYGIKPPDNKQSPVNSFADTYMQMLEKMGLPSIKERFDEVNKEYAKLKDDLAEDISDVENNPWLSEGLRSRKISALNDKYETKLKNKQDELNMYDSLYKSGQEEAKFVATQANLQAYQQMQFNQDIVFKAIEMAEAQAKAIYDLQKEALKAAEPIELSPGATLYDPTTGAAIYTAPTAKQLSGDDSDSDGNWPTPIPGFTLSKSDKETLGTYGLSMADTTSQKNFLNVLSAAQRSAWYAQYLIDSRTRKISISPEIHFDKWFSNTANWQKENEDALDYENIGASSGVDLNGDGIPD